MLHLAVDQGDLALGLGDLLADRILFPLVLLLAHPSLEDAQVRGQALQEVHAQQAVDASADDLCRVTAVGQVLDLLAVEEKEVGNPHRQEGRDGLVPVLGEDVVGETVAQDPQPLLDALHPEAPVALQLEAMGLAVEVAAEAQGDGGALAGIRAAVYGVAQVVAVGATAPVRESGLRAIEDELDSIQRGWSCRPRSCPRRG